MQPYNISMVGWVVIIFLAGFVRIGYDDTLSFSAILGGIDFEEKSFSARMGFNFDFFFADTHIYSIHTCTIIG